VLPAENPIRVAENIAMLDHMTGGRANAGFARGYQRRWVDIMAQQTHGIHGALPDQHDEIDAANRAAFEENFQLIKRCWTEEMISVKGKFWSLPAEGTPWDIPATNMYGKGVENGIVKAVGVVPKPLQKPHPPIFQPFASSEASIRWCAKEGVTAILPTLNKKTETRLFKLYSEISGQPFGQGMGILRDIIVADTDAEAQELWQNSSRFVSEVWFRPFGFRRGLVDPDTGNYPDEEEMLREGYAWVGSVDTVRRQVEQVLERVPVSWAFGWMFNGLVPHAKLMRSIELFKTKVLPRVGLA
jgi:alkanesulfonate monooxygenase SsuD/methylene tetrahydromethanopterin reductase-like flavin-dependent oxidoreductase (luciferase family)